MFDYGHKPSPYLIHHPGRHKSSLCVAETYDGERSSVWGKFSAA